MLAGVTDVKMNQKTKHNKKESGSFQVVEPYEWNCLQPTLVSLHTEAADSRSE